jgi:hypothetical protein
LDKAQNPFLLLLIIIIFIILLNQHDRTTASARRMVSVLSNTKSCSSSSSCSTATTKSDEDDPIVSETWNGKVDDHQPTSHDTFDSTMVVTVVGTPTVTGGQQQQQPVNSVLPSSSSTSTSTLQFAENKIMSNITNSKPTNIHEAKTTTTTTKKTKDEPNAKAMPPPPPPPRKVNFDTIQFREYNLALGDNPATTNGPPLSLDWYYQDTEAVLVDDYEESRPPRRITQQMILPGKVREDMLLSQTKTTKMQITRMVSQVRSSRHQRRVSVAMQDFEEWQEALEFLSRRWRRMRKGISKEREQELLWENAAQQQQEPPPQHDSSKQGRKSKVEKQPRKTYDAPHDDAGSDDTIDDECVLDVRNDDK